MSRRLSSRGVALAVVLAVGCVSQGDGCGGGCVQPIPGGFPLAQRQDNGITVKVSGDGLRYVEQNVDRIIETLTGGLAFDLPCSELTNVDFGIAGWSIAQANVKLCDVNLDGQCSPADDVAVTPRTVSRDPNLPNSSATPATRNMKMCSVTASLVPGSLSVVPSGQGDSIAIPVKMRFKVKTGPIYLQAPLSVLGFGCTAACFVSYDTGKVAPDAFAIDVALKLVVDAKWGHVVAFDVTGLDAKELVKLEDLSLGNLEANTCELGGYNVCDAIDLVNNVALIRDRLIPFLVDRLAPFIESRIEDAIDGFRCLPCDAGFNCPSAPDGTVSSCDRGLGICYTNKAQRQCVPRMPGLEGRVAPASLAAGFGLSPDAMLDLYAVAGGHDGKALAASPGTPDTEAERGIQLAVMGGTRSVVRDAAGTPQPSTVASCVPVKSWQERSPQHAIDFEALANAAPPDAAVPNYHLGIALSDNYLDKTFFDAYQAGLLCLNVDSSISALLSSSLFRTFLPSLGVLTQGQDVPMLIALRPKEAPSVIVGKGTTKIVGGQEIPDDPLLRLSMKSVQIDFYALVEERQSRLFSLTTDLTLPLSLKFKTDPATGKTTVQPVLANLEDVAQNIVATNSEMLSENPQVVAELLEAIIGLVQPVIAGVLKPIELPEFQGFKLKVRDARGAVKYGAPAPGFEHLALLADLELAAQALVMTAETEARLSRLVVPDAREIVNGQKARPVAVIDVEGSGLLHNDLKGYEFAFRVDRGLWSPWTRSARLEVRAPVLVLPGAHLVEVAAREIGNPDSEDLSPAAVPVMIDYDAPTIALRLDEESGELVTDAKDAVARFDELSFRYRANGADWSEPGPAQRFRLVDLGAAPALAVEVTDPSGHVATATWGARPDAATIDGPHARVGGCAGVPVSALGLLVVAALARRRRASR